MNAMQTLSDVPLPAPIFLIILTAVYGLLQFAFPDLPFTQEQIEYVLTKLFQFLGIVIVARARAQSLI